MAEEKVFQDLALQGNSALGLRTDTSWTSTDRAIPFSISGEPLRIALVNTNSSKGLTYNPNTGAVKAGSFVKRGGTASQFLKADGSVDNNSYLTSHQSVENASEEMAWGSEKKLATVGDTDITIKFPANPNTDYKVRQTNLTTNANRPLLMAYANNTTQQDQIAYKNTGILANPSTKIITANGFALNGGNNRQLLTGVGGSIQIENLEGYRRMYGDFELLCPTNEILNRIDLNDWDVVRYAIGDRDIGGAERYYVTLSNHIYEGIEGKEYYIFLYNISSVSCSVHIYDTFGQYETVNVYSHHSLTIAFTKVIKEKFMINYVYTPSYPYGVDEQHYNEEPTAYLPAYFTYSVEKSSDVLGDFLSNFRGKNDYTLDKCTSKKITLYAELMGGRHTANVQYLTEAFKSGIPFNNMEVTLYCHNGQKDAQYITYNGKGDVMPIPTGFTYKCVYTYFNGSWLITEPVLLNDVNAK